MDTSKQAEYVKQFSENAGIMAETTNNGVFNDHLQLMMRGHEPFFGEGETFPFEAYKSGMQHLREMCQKAYDGLPTKDRHFILKVLDFQAGNDRVFFQQLCHRDATLGILYMQFIIALGGFIHRARIASAEVSFEALSSAVVHAEMIFLMGMSSGLIQRFMLSDMHSSIISAHNMEMEHLRSEVKAIMDSQGSSADLRRFFNGMLNLFQMNFNLMTSRQQHLLEKNES